MKELAAQHGDIVIDVGQQLPNPPWFDIMEEPDYGDIELRALALNFIHNRKPEYLSHSYHSLIDQLPAHATFISAKPLTKRQKRRLKRKGT